jgi:hypothetical protein
MNEKQSSFNSRLVVDDTDVTTASAASTTAATGENDMINECSFNEAIDRDDHEKVQGFISNTEDEPIHRGVIEQVTEEGWVGWKSFPDDIFSYPEVMNAVKSNDVTTQELQAISHPYLSNTDGVVAPTLLEDPSSSSSFTIDSSRSSSSSRFATTTLRSNSTTVGVRFTGVSVSVRSSNENSSGGMQLRLPSKDEIQSIIDASNAPPRSAHGKTLLISIDESETNKMNTSWASGL